MMIDRLRPVAGAFAFLTRVPIRGGVHEINRIAPWFPLVGVVVGLVVGLIHLGLSEVTAAAAAAATAVAVGVAVTGAFHEDGLGDMADGFGGGWNPEQRLEIMKDSRLGTYGVMAIAVTLLIRVTALSELDGLAMVALVVTVHLLSRTWAMLVLGFARPARVGGLAAEAAVGGSRSRLGLVAVAWIVLAVVLVGPGRAALVGSLGLLAAGATTALAYRKIGGVTGDVLGAVQQMAEAAGLLAATFAWGA